MSCFQTPRGSSHLVSLHVYGVVPRSDFPTNAHAASVSAVLVYPLVSLSEEAWGVNCFLSYLCDSAYTLTQRTFFSWLPHTACCNAALLLCGRCVEGSWVLVFHNSGLPNTTAQRGHSLSISHRNRGLLHLQLVRLLYINQGLLLLFTGLLLMSLLRDVNLLLLLVINLLN